MEFWENIFGHIDDPGEDKYRGMQNDRSAFWAGGPEDSSEIARHHRDMARAANATILANTPENTSVKASTFVMGTFNPTDSRLTVTGVGDSPFIALVLDKDGNPRLDQSRVINHLHTANPYESHMINRTLGVDPNALDLEGTQRSIDFSDSIRRGDRVVLIAATDGLIDHTGVKEIPGETYKQAFKRLNQDIQGTVNRYAQVASQVMKNGGGDIPPQKLADAIHAESHRMAVERGGPDALRMRDNLHMQLAVVDQHTRAPLNMGAFDGVGARSARASEAVFAAVRGYVGRHSLSASPRQQAALLEGEAARKAHISGEPVQARMAPTQQAADLIASEGWMKGVTGGGANITRLPINDMSLQSVDEMRRVLANAGIQTEIRTSDTLGKTLRIEGDDAIARLHALQTSMRISGAPGAKFHDTPRAPWINGWDDITRGISGGIDNFTHKAGVLSRAAWSESMSAIDTASPHISRIWAQGSDSFIKISKQAVDTATDAWHASAPFRGQIGTSVQEALHSFKSSAGEALTGLKSYLPSIDGQAFKQWAMGGMEATADLGKKAGLPVAAGLSLVVGGCTLVLTGSPSQAGEMMHTCVNPYAETTEAAIEGNEAEAARCSIIETAAWVGGVCATTAAIPLVALAAPIIGTGVVVTGGIVLAAGVGGGIVSHLTADSIVGSAEEFESTFASESSPQAIFTSNISDTFNSATVDPAQLMQDMQIMQISETDLGTMSPEFQALYEFRNSPENFKDQIAESGETLGFVAREAQEKLAQGTAPDEYRPSSEMSAKIAAAYAAEFGKPISAPSA